MLTVWRRLHIEVDSMDNVGATNKEQGLVTQVLSTTCQAPSGSCGVLAVDTSLEEQRFDRGRIEVSMHSFDVLANGFNLSLNSQIVILDGIPVGIGDILPGDSFTIYDDDDFNDSDSGNLDGDRNESLVEPDTSSTSLIHSSDIPCSDVVTSQCNVFAPAYIRPKYDLTGSHDRTPINFKSTDVNGRYDWTAESG